MFVLSNDPRTFNPYTLLIFQVLKIRVTSGSPGLSQWVSGSSGSILVTRLQRWMHTSFSVYILQGKCELRLLSDLMGQTSLSIINLKLLELAALI